MSSAIDIASAALVKLGDKPIASFDEGTVTATTVSTLYPVTRDTLLSCKDWRFAIRSERLARVASTDPVDYACQYQLPDDYIRAISAGLSDYTTSKGLAYDIRCNRLFTNGDGIYLKYIARVDEAFMPAWFVTALIDRLAADLCMAISDDSRRFNLLRQDALHSLGEARRLDGQQRTPLAIRNDALIKVRF